MLSAILFMFYLALACLVTVGSFYICIKATQIMFKLVFNSVGGLFKLPARALATVRAFYRSTLVAFDNFKVRLESRKRKVKSEKTYEVHVEPAEPQQVRHAEFWRKDKDWSEYDKPTWERQGKLIIA